MPTFESSRQYEFISKEEREKIRAVRSHGNLSSEQSLYNTWLNGDWKRQCYYKPTKEKIALIARYEWKHDSNFNSIMSQNIKKIDLKGAFDNCPIPTMIMEGRWDLTWNTDKPGILHKNHPNAKLLFFEESAHTPFDDEPEKFFDVLQNFVVNLPEIASSDLGQWKGYLSKWKKEKENAKGPSFPTGEMSESEAGAIKEFDKIRKKILAGQQYEDTSTPLRTFLTMLSALHLRDAEVFEQVSALDINKMGQKVTNEMMAQTEQYLFGFDILRAPLSPEKPEEGMFWPIFVKKSGGTELADTIVPVFWKGKWMWCGNMGAPGDWRDFQSTGKVILEKFGK